MSDLEEIRRLFELVCDGSTWYGANLSEVINRVGAEHVFLKPPGVKANIAELLQHMTVWRNFALEKEAGNHGYDIELGSLVDWPATPTGSADDWAQIKKDFQASQKALMAMMDRHDTTWLSQIVPEKEYDYRHLLNGMIQHDIYHCGQIAMLHAMLKRLA